MKNTLEVTNIRLNETKGQVNELDDRLVMLAKIERKKKRMKINEDSLRDLWNNRKNTNICIIKIPEGEERGERT